MNKKERNTTDTVTRLKQLLENFNKTNKNLDLYEICIKKHLEEKLY